MTFTVTDTGDNAPSAGGYTVLEPDTPAPSSSNVGDVLGGAWAKLKELAVGAQQVGMGIADLVTPGAPASAKFGPDFQKRAQALTQRADEMKSVMSPENMAQQTPGGKWGSFVTGAALPVAATALFPELFGTPPGQAMLGAIQGGMEPTGQGDSRAGNVALGTALGYTGQKVGQAGASLIKGTEPSANDVSRQAFVQWAEDQGIPISRYQRGGNPFVGLMERVGRALPGSSGYYQDLDAAQIQALNDLYNKWTMGHASGAEMDALAAKVKSLTVDPRAVAEGRAFGGQFSNLRGDLSPSGAINTAEQYFGTAGQPNPALANLGPAAQQQAVAQGVPAVVGGKTGALQAGDQIPFGMDNGYMAIRSGLTRAMYNAKGADQQAYGKLLDIFDENAYRTMQAAGIDPQQLINLRGAYSVQKLLAPAMTELPDGTFAVNPSKLKSIIQFKMQKSPSYFGNLPGNTGQEITSAMNAAKFMSPVSSSHTTELGVAKGIMTGEALNKALEHGAGAATDTAMALWLVPKLANMVLQGTSRGIPGVNRLPVSSQTLGNLMSAAVPSGVESFAPWAVPALGAGAAKLFGGS
jgi:hypothetical protein